ncbi:putative Ribosomal protein-related [Melia azedarach]|uniref:Ribosomal protein-related n=1 Tax=Melia azedarach TaxID=155640 RepID=A0ACC1Y6P9_MELAZ|nr:putative Ribosomal protein-related [Melia azedarach]
MEQPSLPNTTKPTNTPKKKIPSPQELISHYTTQGLDQEQASIKVIEDLQNVLFRIIASNSKNKNDKFMAETSKKIDVVNSRVAIVDMKLDSKPGYGETFALGIASGAALNGIGSVFPHVVKGLAQIWSTVRNATDPSSPAT